MDEIEQRYRDLEPSLKRSEKEVQQILSSVLKTAGSGHLMRARLRDPRVKTLASLRKKIANHEWGVDEAFAEIGDLVGFRIVCSNLEDIRRCRDLVLSSDRFQLVKEEDYIATPQSSGYRALHLNVNYQLGQGAAIQIVCEIQIRTLAQEAWGVLTHADIYKDGGNLPSHIGQSSRRLANLLSVCDEIAQDIREQVSQAATSNAPEDEEIDTGTLAFMYRRAFGEDASDYETQLVAHTCAQLGCYRLDALDRVLTSAVLQASAREAYESVSGFSFTNDTWFEVAPYFAVRDEQSAIAAVRKIAQDELDDVEHFGRAESLADLPNTIDEFISELTPASHDEDGIVSYDLAQTLNALSECSSCAAPIIDVDELISAILDHYDEDDPTGSYADDIRDTVMNSGLEVGDDGNADICSYHGYVLSRD